MSPKIKILTTKEVKSKWDAFSKTFQSYNEPSTLPVAMLLMANLGLTNPKNQVKSILEVACGAGASTDLILHYKKNETKLVACDLSNEMILLAKDRLGMKSNEDEIKSKNLKLIQADAEHLPIEDGSIDRYMANYCLHLVNDPDRMLKDAYRVLEKGGIAAFSVWGRPCNTNQYATLSIVAKGLGIKLIGSGARKPFHLSDIEKLRQMALNAGFPKVQAGYSYFNQIITCGDDYADIYLSTPDTTQVCQKIGPEKTSIFRKRIVEYVDDLIRKGFFIGQEVAYIICFK